MMSKKYALASTHRICHRGWLHYIIMLLMVAVSILPLTTLNAAPAAASSASATKASQDTFGRDTPRGTVQGFLQALAQNDVLLASRYLDVGNSRNPNAMVAELKSALDSGGRIATELQISNDPAGKLDDKLAPNIDKVGEIAYKDGNIDILLERVTQNNAQVWLFSKTTLQNIHNARASYEPTLVEKYVPKAWLKKDFKGFSLGHVAAVLALLAATFLISLLISWILYGIYGFVYRLSHRPKSDTDKKVEMPLDSRVIVPMAMVLTGVIIKELMIIVGINLVVRNVVSRLADILSWVALAWLLLRIIDIVFKRAEKLAVIGDHPERFSVINLLRKVMKVLLLAVATIVILGNLGFDLTTGIAALGIGGLALALGAQKTIENLVGSVSLVADQPVNVGDYCKFGNQEGTVEDIGIRSTRLRTSNRTVVTIPNGSFSSMSIENVSSRDMFYFKHNFYIARDSDTAKVREFIEMAQIFITNHPATNSVANEVRIADTQQDAYIIEVRCYMEAKGAIDFNSKQTEMILRIAEMMRETGLINAVPTSQITVQSVVETLQSAVNLKKDKDAK